MTRARGHRVVDIDLHACEAQRFSGHQSGWTSADDGEVWDGGVGHGEGSGISTAPPRLLH
jgi:hypothetical protein